MKVRDLIGALQDFDPDAEVWYACNSEYAGPLDPKDVWQGDPTPTWLNKPRGLDVVVVGS